MHYGMTVSHTVLFQRLASIDSYIYNIAIQLNSYQMHVLNLPSYTLQQNLFSKCDTCVKFSQERLKFAGQKEAAVVLHTEFKAHLNLVE